MYRPNILLGGNRGYRNGYSYGYGYGFGRGVEIERNCGCGCECKEFNFYGFPPPLRKEMKRLDTTQLTIHTDEFIRKACIKDGCCPPKPVIIKDEKKTFIIHAETECLKKGYYYTLDIDRDVPCEVCGLDTYLLVSPCQFRPGEIGLNFTKTIHGGCLGGIGDGYADEIIEDGEFVEADSIPTDPAFPATELVGWHGFRDDGKSELIPVKLDLHASIATGENFFTGRFKIPGTGRPYSNHFVLFLNNANEFILSRNWRRRSDYN